MISLEANFVKFKHPKNPRTWRWGMRKIVLPIFLTLFIFLMKINSSPAYAGCAVGSNYPCVDEIYASDCPNVSINPINADQLYGITLESPGVYPEFNYIVTVKDPNQKYCVDLEGESNCINNLGYLDTIDGEIKGNVSSFYYGLFPDSSRSGVHELKVFSDVNHNHPYCVIYYNVLEPVLIPTSTPTPIPAQAYEFSSCDVDVLTDLNEETGTAEVTVNAAVYYDTGSPEQVLILNPFYRFSFLFFDTAYLNSENKGFLRNKSIAGLRVNGGINDLHTLKYSTSQTWSLGRGRYQLDFYAISSQYIPREWQVDTFGKLCKSVIFNIGEPLPSLTPTQTPEETTENDARNRLKNICGSVVDNPDTEDINEKYDCMACVSGEEIWIYTEDGEEKVGEKGQGILKATPKLDSPGAYTAIGCLPTDLPTFISGYVFTIGLGIGGGVGFLLMLWGAFTILVSSGNPEQIKHGQEIIVSAIAGLLLIIFSVLILKVIGVDILKIPGFT